MSKKTKKFTINSETSVAGWNAGLILIGCAPVPEASSVVSFGLLLLGSFGGMMLRVRQRSAVN
ncbi:MAG: hypothetical protein ACRYFS_11150 [Janthinobacterium lividum]